LKQRIDPKIFDFGFREQAKNFEILKQKLRKKSELKNLEISRF